MRPDFQGVGYPERWKIAVAERAELTIYVLPFGQWTSIHPRSGIVGRVVSDLHALCYFEGWKYGAAQYKHLDARGQWEAAIQHAAGRMLTEYPTVARQMLPTTQLIPVGTFYADGDRIEITDEAEVARWLS